MNQSLQDGQARTDGASSFWLEEHKGAPLVDRNEDLNDDVTSAVREAGSRSDDDDAIDQSRDYIEELRHGFGSLPNALNYNLRLVELYRHDPIQAREWYKRDYNSRFPDPRPAPPPKEQAPEYLNAQGRIEWERDQAVRDAVRQASDEAKYRAELEEARPLLARVKEQWGLGLRDALQRAAAVHQAATIGHVNTVADRLSYIAGAPSTQAHAEDQARYAQQEQHKAQLWQWYDGVVKSGALPGIEHQAVQDATAEILEHWNATKQRSGDMQQDLVNAYSHAVQAVQRQLQIDQEKAAAERSKRASGSISGAPGSHGSSDDGDDVYAAVRRAVRAHAV